ncbi:methyltransferase domain-containing protein [Shewanella inventionis]|uniref:methyltransferase domain-containing protein n=1 Tax=Shewanella inventionis TaxID=1738770 RepID=UPI001CBE11A3|nr:methyltransferase domain-containing protein [Shewanella inventionis]
MTLDNPLANKFSSAARQYKQHDVLQRLSAQQLLKQANLNGTLLDIGAGPGTDFSALTAVNQVVAVDIAHGMLTELTQQFTEYLPLCSDAQALGLQAESVDSIYSNLALQWCPNLPQACCELHRVLRPNGECHVSIVADGSLAELKTLGFHVNQFNSVSALKQAFMSSQTQNNTWQSIDIKLECIQVYFDDLRSLLYSIKGVGASFAQHNPNRTVLKKQQWQQRVELAQRLRTEKGIPLTYQIAFIRAKRG